MPRGSIANDERLGAAWRLWNWCRWGVELWVFDTGLVLSATLKKWKQAARKGQFGSSTIYWSAPTSKRDAATIEYQNTLHTYTIIYCTWNMCKARKWQKSATWHSDSRVVPLDTAAAKTRGGLTSCGVCAGEAAIFFGWSLGCLTNPQGFPQFLSFLAEDPMIHVALIPIIELNRAQWANLSMHSHSEKYCQMYNSIMYCCI